MVKKTKFIDKKTARHFHVVHRSLRDPLAGDTDAPQHVLQEFTPPNSSRSADDTPPLFKDHDKEDTDFSDVKSSTSKHEDLELGEAAQQGIFFQDQNEYDYMQHMRQVGQAGSSTVWLEAPAQKTSSKPAEIPITLREEIDDEEDDDSLLIPRRKVRFELPQVVLPPTAMSSSIAQGEQGLDLDPDVMEALAALEDEEYITEFADDFVEAFQVPADTQDDEFQDASYDSDGLEYSDDSDSEYEVRTAFTGLSMTSSAMHRNAGLSLLDDRFDKVMEEYDDEEIGELESDLDDPEEAGHKDLSQFNSMFDDFLTNQDLRGSRLINANANDPLAELDDVRKNLGGARLDGFIAGDDGYDEEVEQIPEETAHDDGWDCQTILTTYSNTENRPKLIDARPKRERRTIVNISHTTGMPLGVLRPRLPPVSEEEDNEDDEIKINKGVSRDRNESAVEKKQRKQEIKASKQNRRLEKKATKIAFSEEKKRLEAIKRPEYLIHSI